MAGWRGRPGFRTVLNFLACVLGVVSPCLGAVGRHTMGECVDRQGRAQRCMPEFENAAFNKLVVATNTCGDPPIEYCLQTGVTGVTKSCHMCDSARPRLAHPPRYLTDFNNDDNTTWWQSETMLQGVQYPNEVNITLSLGKAFDITYVRLKFHTSRPESFAIYKRTTEDGEWIPYQYYSGSCRTTFQKVNRGVITNRDETEAICTDEFSDISPLTGGNVAFSTLEGRPSAYNFDNSLILQGWVTATDIRIRLRRLNTFGDEVFRDPKVMSSYYYAISDFAVGGRCKCNGHAASCEANVNTGAKHGSSACASTTRAAWTATGACPCTTTDRGEGQRRQILTSVKYLKGLPPLLFILDREREQETHLVGTTEGEATFGTQVCNLQQSWAVIYNASPWVEGSPTPTGNCTPLAGSVGGGGQPQQLTSACNCNNLADSCEFDSDLYRRTGHGGRCIGCRQNTAGPNCERCLEYYYRAQQTDPCQPCNCNPLGSIQQQCDPLGRCQCKPGVGGDKCDRCQDGHFGLSEAGCRQCSCDSAGTVNNAGACDQVTGQCQCKQNVEGPRCDRCKPGYFNLDSTNPSGCISCFCYGHSAKCAVASGYAASVISTPFTTGQRGWTGEDRLGMRGRSGGHRWGRTWELQLTARSLSTLSLQYLGNQRLSYGQTLTFKLRVDPEDVRLSAEDIVLEGNGIRLSAAMTAQQNPVPRRVNQDYSFRLHEDPSLGWNQRLSSFDFNRLLSNLTSLKIRGTYTDRGRGFLDDVRLNTAVRSGAQPAATWVEVCECPEGLTGQFCEQVVPGYKQENPGRGPFSPVEPCFCNSHSATCDTVTGECSCQHNTEGIYCERCLKGYYGDATQGTPNDCQPCPCPNQAPCDLAPNGEVVCTSCTEGYIGDSETGNCRDNPQTGAEDSQRQTELSETREQHELAKPEVANHDENSIHVQLQGPEVGREPKPGKRLENSQQYFTQQYPQFVDASPVMRDMPQNDKSDVAVERLRQETVQSRPHSRRPMYPNPGRKRGQQRTSTIKGITRPTYPYSGQAAEPLYQAPQVKGPMRPTNRPTGPAQQPYWSRSRTKGPTRQHSDPYPGQAQAEPFDLPPCPTNIPSRGSRAEPMQYPCNPCGGDRCERCMDGYYGDPIGQYGQPRPCQRCICSGNIDENAVGNCNSITGECLKCVYFTTGTACERCLPGYYGDATSFPKPPCKLPPPHIADMVAPCCHLYALIGVVAWLLQKGECAVADEQAAGMARKEVLLFVLVVLSSPGLGQGYFDFDLSWLTDNLDLPDLTDLPADTDTETDAEEALVPKACNCYQFGTQVGGECDQTTGQCPCLSNVVGLQCDRCVDGYWNINSGSGCEQCDCDQTGSLDTSCELNSGQCQCKPGVGGRRCDKCLANHYGFSSTGCTACDCDPRGSLRLQCDEFGRCPCREGVVGDKCDACKENYYDVARGCIECPACYGLVQDKVDEHREKLRQLRDLINNVGVNPDLINDQKFEERLKQVEELAKDLLNEARKAAGGAGINADSLRQALDALRGKVNEIEKAKNNAQATTNDAKVKVQDADETIRRIQDKLREANNYLDNEGKQALEEAKQAAANFGQGSREMQELAEQAKELANDQTEDAQAIEDTANQALQTSKDALKAVRDALAGQGDIANKRIPDLERKLQDAEEQLDKVNREAADALANAEASAARATKILANSQARQPNIDVEDLKRQTAAIKDEAENSLIPDIAKLETDNQQTVNDINENYDAAEQLLKDAQDKQDVIDQLLARADAANDKAEQAEEKGRETLGEAQKTLEYLSNFEAKVQESKDKADEALGKEAEIRRIIDEAVATTDQAEEALGSADSDARTAKKTAEQAKQIAEGAAADAKQVKEDANTIYAQAAALNNNADELKGDVDSAENTFNQKKRQADDDETRVNAAMAAANDAQRKADLAMGKVEGTLDRVNKILDQLASKTPLVVRYRKLRQTCELVCVGCTTDRFSGSGGVDEGRLRAVQAEYDRIKGELDPDSINAIIANLRIDARAQGRLLSYYETLRGDVMSEIRNLEEILRSLPDGCFRPQKIEQL
ncbi:biological adhesion [Branchiostoma belcheri]|nr:biological adhesion [Branchiostoma belcheri]